MTEYYGQREHYICSQIFEIKDTLFTSFLNASPQEKRRHFRKITENTYLYNFQHYQNGARENKNYQVNENNTNCTKYSLKTIHANNSQIKRM